MAVQGMEKPQTYAPFRDFLTGQQTVVVYTIMEEDQMTITPLHSVTRFATAAHHHNRYDGSILGAVGERQGEDGPMWVKLKNTALQWEKYTPVMGWGDNNAMAERYDNPANRLTPFGATAEAKGDVQWIPKAQMLHMEVALNVARKPTTPWKLLELLEEFVVDKDPQVGTALDPIEKWTVAAATQGKDDSSTMASPLQPVTMPSRQLKAFLKRHLDRTLGDDKVWIF